jgi:hypothetical protein
MTGRGFLRESTYTIELSAATAPTILWAPKDAKRIFFIYRSKTLHNGTGRAARQNIETITIHTIV